MRALQLFADRDLRLVEMDEPPRLGPDEALIEVSHVALNHIDVWGWRGMAFAQRKLPLVIGAEAAARIVAVGSEVEWFRPGHRVVVYGANVCGVCLACRQGRENLCQAVRGVMGFHIDGFARERLCVPARLLLPVPDGVALEDAACAPVTFGTVQHMLFDNAKLQRGESILVQAGGSGIGTIAIKLARALDCTILATAGSEAKCKRVLALGADHAINYITERFEGRVRKLTAKVGVDVVFEHVGAATWEGSLFSLKPGGRLVTCGSTSGVSAQMNLMMLFQRQLRIIGSFGCTMGNVAQGLEWMQRGVRPVIDAVVPLERIGEALARLEGRGVFGKVIVGVCP